MTIHVRAFYKFVPLSDVRALRGELRGRLAGRDIKGTILLAPEGINATISGAPDDMRDFLAALRTDERFADLNTRDAATDRHPFKRMKVKLKREIISFRRPEADPSRQVGSYVAPENWNALITSPDVLVLDARNAYEVAEGTFQGAVDPKTRTFGEFADFAKTALSPQKHPKIAMFCTGGIRCEKASAYLKSLGFPEVYHLKGGILAYLETVPPSASLWQGECFVFDERETVA